MAVHPPRTAVELAREGIVLAGAGAAIALQVAHRPVAAGVAQHSNFTADPLGRLRRTLEYIFAVVLPEADGARQRVTGWVGDAHAPVQGDDDGVPYSAADPQAQLWVTATLYWTAEEVRWRIWGSHISADEAEAIYRSYADLGTALGMPAGLWPADRAAFRRYWDQQLNRLEVTSAARGIMADLFAAESAPGWLRSAMPLAGFLTAGLLPDPVRVQLGWDWTGTDSRRERRLWLLLQRCYPRLPAGIRQAPSRFIVSGLPR